MLEWRIGGVRLRLSLLFPVTVIVMLSLDTSGMTALCLSAAMLHELGHCIAMLYLHDKPERITCGIFGIRVERRTTQRLSYGALCGVALAGPLTNGVCCGVFVLCGWHTGAMVHALLCLFHLLPVTSLDGGEATYALLCRRFSEQRAEWILMVLSVVTLVPLTILGFAVMMADGYNVSLLVLCGYLILRMFLRVGH